MVRLQASRPQYVISLKAVNCRTGDPLAQEQVTTDDKPHILDALAKAASAMRSKLGESLATIEKFDVPLDQATTSSLESLQAFTLAKRQGARKPIFARAIPLFQRAVSLDPSFAAAYSALSVAYNNPETSQSRIREAAVERNRRQLTYDGK